MPSRNRARISRRRPDDCLHAVPRKWPAAGRKRHRRTPSPRATAGTTSPIARDTRTEIGCHAGGCYHYFPTAITIIDIGGQDNKVIKLDAAGRRTSFKMNRKCAAGTGAFLEEMAARLDIPLERMNDLAARSTDMVKLGSFCTVFSATEVLENIRHGKKIEDIVKGVFFSVIRRVLEMDAMTENVVMTGGRGRAQPLHGAHDGGAHRPDPSGSRIKPQLTGAIGAAIYAMDRSNRNDGTAAS
ncbi:MAG: acyl-CoA dehydratase activase [Desulfobacterales bacterium]|nr:acyl-CoA dehydratase activase [Desulfobacterales bacterium]